MVFVGRISFTEMTSTMCLQIDFIADTTRVCVWTASWY